MTSVGRLVTLGPERKQYRVVGVTPRSARRTPDAVRFLAESLCRQAGYDPNAIVREEGARHGPTYLMVKFWARQAQEQLKCQR